MTLNAVKHLEALIRAMERIQGRWSVDIVPADTDSATKLRFLRESDRNFLAPTPELQGAINRAIADKVYPLLASNPDAIDPRTLYQAAGAAARDHVVGRFLRGGGDVRVRGLKPSTIARKRAARLDPRVGIARGTLLRDIRVRARFLVRRIG